MDPNNKDMGEIIKKMIGATIPHLSLEYIEKESKEIVKCFENNIACCLTRSIPSGQYGQYFLSYRIIFINPNETKDEELGFNIGEEIFHFVRKYHCVSKTLLLKRETTASMGINFPVEETFGKIGRSLLYGLFTRFSGKYPELKDYHKFFKAGVETERNITKENLNEKIVRTGDYIHTKGYFKADALMASYPLLELAIDNPKEFFGDSGKKTIEEIEGKMKRLTLKWRKKKGRTSRFKEKREEAVKKILKTEKKY